MFGFTRNSGNKDKKRVVVLRELWKYFLAGVSSFSAAQESCTCIKKKRLPSGSPFMVRVVLQPAAVNGFTRNSLPVYGSAER